MTDDVFELVNAALFTLFMLTLPFSAWAFDEKKDDSIKEKIKRIIGWSAFYIRFAIIAWALIYVVWLIIKAIIK